MEQIIDQSIFINNIFLTKNTSSEVFLKINFIKNKSIYNLNNSTVKEILEKNEKKILI